MLETHLTSPVTQRRLNGAPPPITSTPLPPIEVLALIVERAWCGVDKFRSCFPPQAVCFQVSGKSRGQQKGSKRATGNRLFKTRARLRCPQPVLASVARPSRLFQS
jgi:hypothetical protein